MRHVIYILTLAIVLTKCTSIDNSNSERQLTSDSSAIRTIQQIVTDSLLAAENSSFADIKTTSQISRQDFNLYKQNYATECVLDSGEFIRGSSLYVLRSCKEICDTYLAERKTNRKLLLPSSYDAGIASMLLSPSCKNLVVWSSFDSPDFENYYENRAEFYSFTVAGDMGVKGIKPASKHFSKDWSIDDLTWINDRSIALKVYRNKKPTDGNDKEYKYFKADLFR